nr:PREDICTED: B3 domain-containing transcription factor VRN1-like isoform X1 [Daucus carota subsp. sativus]
MFIILSISLHCGFNLSEELCTQIFLHSQLSWADMMPGKPNRFFKIILTNVGSHTKLQLPREFLRIFSKNLKDSIMLNVPGGLEWPVDLERQKAKVWLQNGWPKFADCYSISFGYLLVFEYMGDSKFQVFIFDPSSLEIDYPLASNDKPDAVKSAQVKRRLIDIDESETSDNSSSSDDSSSSDYAVRYCKKKKAKSTSSEESANLGLEKAPTEVQKDRATAVANAFKSKNPFFVHAMKASHIVGGGWPNVYIPKTFKDAYKKWQSNEKLILDVEGNSWIVSCNLNLNCRQCRISRGWTIFARENSLVVGDVCVFELINRSSKRFKVFISRAAKETNDEGNKRLARVRSEAERARVLESVEAYKPNRPFFTVKVHRCYLYGGSMTVPMDFINKYITRGSCSIDLQLPDGKVWSVKCYIRDKCAKFSAGWKNFSIENKLAAGDICGFELVNKSLLKVAIFRVG